MTQPTPCPKCGRVNAKLTQSRQVFPPFTSPTVSRAVAVADTYECECGAVFVVSVPIDPNQPPPDAGNAPPG